jgi:protein-S-isoprenylcysteine O-methyltransferase Ste14
MKWFLRFLFSMFLSFLCMMGALGSKYPLSVFLVYLGKGIWILFFIAYFWNRDKRIKQKKDFEEYMRRRNRSK